MLPYNCVSEEKITNVDEVQRPPIEKMLLQRKITDLNYDCLCYIINYLSFIDRFRLALASDCFYDLIVGSLSVELLDYDDFKNAFTVEEAEKLLSLYGSQLERLNYGENYFGSMNTSYFDLLLKYCKNLKEIHICPSKLTLAKNCSQTLMVLNVKSQQLTDFDCELIGNLDRLQRLEIQGNHDVSGQYLTNLKTLTDLRISNCSTFRPEHLIAICRNNRLMRLEISSCCKLTTESFRTIVETQSESLEYLAMSSFTRAGNINVLMQLKSLRHLEIHHGVLPNRNVQLFRDIVEHCRDRLETFRIVYEFVSIPVDVELDCICQLRNLKSLEVLAKNFPLEYLSRLADNRGALEILKLWNVLPPVSEEVEQYVRDKLPKLKQFIVKARKDKTLFLIGGGIRRNM